MRQTDSDTRAGNRVEESDDEKERGEASHSAERYAPQLETRVEGQYGPEQSGTPP